MSDTFCTSAVSLLITPWLHCGPPAQCCCSPVCMHTTWFLSSATPTLPTMMIKHSKITHLKNSARTAAAFSSAPRSSPRRTRRPSTFYGPIFDQVIKRWLLQILPKQNTAWSTFTSLLVCAHAYHSNYPLARTVCVLCPVDIENWVNVRIFTWIPLTLVAPNGIGPLGRMNLFK